jgi:hypothetical protein
MGGTVQSRIGQNPGIGLGSWRRCAIAIRQWLRAAQNCGSPHTITKDGHTPGCAIRQWLRAAHNCGKSAENAQDRQYTGVNPKINAGKRSEKDQDGGDEPQELVHAVFHDTIVLDCATHWSFVATECSKRAAQKMPQVARIGNRVTAGVGPHRPS